MRSAKLLFSSLLAFSVMISCTPRPSQPEGAPPEVDPAAVRAAIEEANAKLEMAVQNQDAAALAALYTEDGALFPPGAEIARGRDGLEALGTGLFAAGFKTIQLDTLEVEVSGDAAFEIGEATLRFEPEGGLTVSAKSPF